MFYRKSKEHPPREYVSCYVCRHLVLLSYIKYVDGRYYCPEHKPPYDSIEYQMGGRIRYYKTILPEIIEVTEKGIPIKY